MQMIKEWALSLVIISVVGTVVLVLSPSGSIEKQVKTAVSIVMLVVFLMPFFSGLRQDSVNFKIERKTPEFSSDDYNRYLVESFEYEINMNIIRLLEREGITTENVVSEVQMNSDNEIFVEKVTVYIPEKHRNDEKKIYDLIKNEYGILVDSEVVD